MSISEYISNNYQKLYQAAKNITKGHDLTDDLFQHCIEVILTDKNQEKILVMAENNQLHYYFVSILIRNYNSSTSRFHYQYRKPIENFTDKDVYDMDIEQDDYDHSLEPKIEFIEENIKDLSFYDKKMLEYYYYDGMSYQQISDLTRIPKTSVWNTVTKTIKKIKENID